MTKQEILKACHNNPKVADAAAKGVLRGGVLILANEKSLLRKYLNDAVNQICETENVDKAFVTDAYSLCAEIAKQDQNFIIDLLAMTGGYVTIKELSVKYA